VKILNVANREKIYMAHGRPRIQIIELSSEAIGMTSQWCDILNVLKEINETKFHTH